MKKIGVLGTGTMGAGIIQVLAQNGYEVVLRARRESSVEKGIATVEKNLDRLIKKEKITEADKQKYKMYQGEQIIEKEKCFPIDLKEKIPPRYITFLIKKNRNHYNIIHSIKEEIIEISKRFN